MINLKINFLNDGDRVSVAGRSPALLRTPLEKPQRRADRTLTTKTRKAMDWTAALGKAVTAITAGAMLACAVASFIAAPIPTAAILSAALAKG